MKHTILLADDSVTIQKVVELTFLDEDVRVVSVGNGSDALARLEDLRPDVILADVHMPGADGYEVCQAARRALPGVQVLLLVGTFEIFDPERASAAGATGHMKKPFDSQELLRRVRELLAAGRTSAPVPFVAPVATQDADPAPDLPFEAPDWEPADEVAPEPVQPLAASEEPEGESWSFEPVTEAAPEAALEAPAESWSAFTTSRFAVPAAEAPISFDPRPEQEPEAAPEPEPEPMPELVPVPVAAAHEEPAAPVASGSLSDADFERLAQRVAEILSDRAVKDVAWEVVPDLAEVLLKARIRELEAAVE